MKVHIRKTFKCGLLTARPGAMRLDREETMDETDRKILDILRENARMSFSEIGSAVGISRVSVKKRMTAMEEAGIIRGYRAVID